MTRDPIRIESDRLVIRSLKKEDLKGLEAFRCDQRVYCYEPTFLMELQGTPEEALETLQNMDLYEDRQCILAFMKKQHQPYWSGWRNSTISNHPEK